jgi:hypothetical protein
MRLQSTPPSRGHYHIRLSHLLQYPVGETKTEVLDKDLANEAADGREDDWGLKQLLPESMWKLLQSRRVGMSGRISKK